MPGTGIRTPPSAGSGRYCPPSPAALGSAPPSGERSHPPASSRQGANLFIICVAIATQTARCRSESSHACRI
eukprot:4605532-Heterocapsa_arctica.AAC.1